MKEKKSISFNTDRIQQVRTFFLAWGLILFSVSIMQAQNVTPATGGENISADDYQGSYTSLTDIIIDETSTGQISVGQLHFVLPGGFEWDTNTTPSVDIEAATGFSGRGTGLEIEFASISASTITFNVLETSDQPPNKAGKATFSGFAVRPATDELPNQGSISASGAAVSNVNANYGSLKMVAGTPSDLFIETAADGSGDEVAAQNLTAGNSITVYAISRDDGGNFIQNVDADSWSLTNKTGLTANPLSVAGDNRSATFSSTLVGSAGISASAGGLASNSSGTISVVADEPSTLEIQTQPSATNTAGTAFDTQPVLLIKDQYGNTVSSDNFTSVTASRSSGTGTLRGTTTQAASGGTVTFTDLYHTVANTIDLSFTASGLSGSTSNAITINPAAADSLTFVVQPPNGARNTALDPAPEVQLLDTYGNSVSNSGTTITLVKAPESSGPGNINGINSVATNSSGIAVFSDIRLNQNGTYVLTATSDGLADSENSNTFTIADAGSLAGFEIRQSGGGDIATQVAGEPFGIGIAAVDGVGDTLDGQEGRNNFTGYVNLTASSRFADDIDTTQVGPFVDGVYDPSPPYEVKLLQSGGSTTITATNNDGNESGTSNAFVLNPNQAFADSTELSVYKSSLTANGSDTTLVTVQLRDSLDNALVSGGDDVTISHSGDGNLSSLTDNGDGSYTAILTAPTDIGSATFTVEVNGTTATGISETVVFNAGPLATFRIEDAAGNSGTLSDQTAGSPFDIRITAKDANNNTVESFDGTVEISSDATFTSGSGTTASFTDGELASHTVALTSAGDFKLRARRTGFSEVGESNQFTVHPAPADLATSTVTSDLPYLENNGTDHTTIRVQLRDAYGNKLTSQDGNQVNLLFESSSAASLSSTAYQGNGLFTGNLTAGTNIETVRVIGALNSSTSSPSSDIDTVEVVITEFNTWQSTSGGNRADKRDWGIADNWNIGSVPTTGQVIDIPTTPANESFYPIIEQNSTIDFLDIKNQATVNLEPNYTLTLNNDMSGLGTFICDRSTVIVKGDLTVATFASSTCNVTFTGSGAGEISGNTLTGDVTFDRDMTLTGSLESLTSLTVTEGNTLTIEDGANIDIQGTMQIDGELVFNGGHLTISSDITSGSQINISNTTVEFNGTTAQDITGLDNFSNLIINNSEGVTFHNDVVVNDTLFLDNGMLTLDSGSSLVSTVKSGNLSNIRMLREISGTPGWRMIAPPLASTYQDLLDSTVTQGYENSELGLTDSNGDSLQPSVLYYDETYEGTDNQRWRVPGDAGNSLTPGRGLFVYFFGDIDVDDRYNNPLPDTLSISGAENDGTGSSFTFPVTYTAEADTGWNLVGNPYAATIDWDDGNWTKQNMDNVIYVWDPAANDYQEYNGIDGDPALDDGLIMPFQAFWVKANGDGPPQLTVNESSKTTGGEFLRKSGKQPASIEFRLQADSLSKTSHITLSPDGKNGKDRRDAFRLLPFDTQTYLELFFTLEDGTELSINNLARSFGKKISIPIHVGGFVEGAPIEGEYTLSWPEFGNVPDAWTLILTDHETGEEVDLRKNGFYGFDHRLSKQKQPLNNTASNFTLVNNPNNSKAKTAENSGSARFTLTIDPGSDAQDLPGEYALHPNYPNPFHEETTLEFDTPLQGHVEISIYDILGRKVKTIVDESLPANFHERKWRPAGLASGVYICVMRAGDKQFTKKITYIK
ncbi:invasin domain 3-containing protein [Halalkalibaculum sp. DA3122]|uniref:invasin domain 3-containing protein n=1 Tax=unclassified Halalkalibaculum TaxID=2964617 RepID=UPI00375515AD